MRERERAARRRRIPRDVVTSGRPSTSKVATRPVVLTVPSRHPSDEGCHVDQRSDSDTRPADHRAAPGRAARLMGGLGLGVFDTEPASPYPQQRAALTSNHRLVAPSTHPTTSTTSAPRPPPRRRTPTTLRSPSTPQRQDHAAPPPPAPATTEVATTSSLASPSSATTGSGCTASMAPPRLSGIDMERHRPHRRRPLASLADWNYGTSDDNASGPDGGSRPGEPRALLHSSGSTLWAPGKAATLDTICPGTYRRPRAARTPRCSRPRHHNPSRRRGAT